jgi:hypothetical protein
LCKLGFGRFSIFRPAMLKGRPKGRFVEDVGQVLLKGIEWMAPNRMSVECHTVAVAMV